MDSPTKLPKLLIKKLHKDAIIPKKGSPGAAAYDLYSIEDYTLKQFERKWIKTGIAISIPKGWYGRVASRSGLSSKGIDIGAGVLDSDYTGEVKVLILYIGETIEITKHHSTIVQRYHRLFKITKGMKIAQVIFTKCTDVEIEVVDKLPNTKRGSDGFGSTG